MGGISFRPYAQRLAYRYTCVSCPPFWVSKHAQKEWTPHLPPPKKRAEKAEGHCLKVRKHVYHPFVHVFDTRNGRQQRHNQVRCAFCNGSIVDLSLLFFPFHSTENQSMQLPLLVLTRNSLGSPCWNPHYIRTKIKTSAGLGEL